MYHVFKNFFFIYFLICAVKSENFNCNQLKPFLFAKFFLGVDITKLNLFPEFENIESFNGFKETPIFEFNCSEKNKFQISNNLDLVNFYLPDHTKVELYNLNANYEKDSRIFEKDEKEYQSNLIKNFELDSFDDEEKKILNKLNYETNSIEDLLIGSFKLNNYYLKVRSTRILNKRIPLETKININGYRIDFDSSKLTLSNAFLNHINLLSENYEETKNLYDELVFTYGTHYFENFYAGGVAKIKLEKTENKINETGLIKNNFTNFDPFNITMKKLNFTKVKNFGYNETLFKDDKFFFKKKTYLYGGNIDYKNFSIDNWAKTTLIDPWLIKGKLIPLSRLIKNANKKKNFLRAMMAYIDKAEVFNLKQSLDALKNVYSNETRLKELENIAEKLNQQKIVNHKDLLSLSKNITNEINKQIKILYSNNSIKDQDNLLTISLKNYLETSNSCFKTSNYMLTLSFSFLILVFLKILNSKF